MKKSQKIPFNFCCQLCDYTTSSKKDYNKHLSTSKHIFRTTLNNPSQQTEDKLSPHVCPFCNKNYSARNSLWYHKQKCCKKNVSHCENLHDNTVDTTTSDKELMLALIKDNTELKTMLFKVLENGTNNTTNNITNTNSNNKTFNLNLYLHETCKDAMNIDDFVSLIQPTLEDLEYVGRVGYVEGISNIILDNLKKVAVNERPFHCSDIKREIIYIKDNNEWIKETNEKPLLITAIKNIAYKNIKNIPQWQQKNPGCTKPDSIKNDLYLKITLNAMCGSTKEETNKNINKIISNISKRITIDKT